MLSIIILSLFLQIPDCNNNQQMVDTNKRFSNIINYIKHDSVIKEVIYQYYPEIECFDFPDTTEFGKYDVDYFMFVTIDTNKSLKYKWNLRKKMDSINAESLKKYVKKFTNYKKSDTCQSNYNFVIYFTTNDIWTIYLAPKIYKPGFYRSISYTFIFNNDKIIKVRTFHVLE